MFLHPEMVIPSDGILIRPPSEAESLIFQVTLGCSDNHCSFCPAYKQKSFSVKPLTIVADEMKAAARFFPQARRIFLADGDALTLETNHLIEILKIAAMRFPRLRRAGIYGSAKNIEQKTVSELRELKNHKLGIVYIGIESGDETVYRATGKYGTPSLNVEACQKLSAAGITVNATVILGLGGKDHWQDHALHTAGILNQARPDHIAALTLMVEPGTLLYEEMRSGRFVPQTPFGMVKELSSIIENLEPFSCQFFANHASNYVPVRARLPHDRNSLLVMLKTIMVNNDAHSLKVESLRGL